jgi:hypothetical protein
MLRGCNTEWETTGKIRASYQQWDNLPLRLPGSSAMPKLEYDVCARCGALFDDQGENGWWIREGLWWHECDAKRPARIVVRKLELKKSA